MECQSVLTDKYDYFCQPYNTGSTSVRLFDCLCIHELLRGPSTDLLNVWGTCLVNTGV